MEYVVKSSQMHYGIARNLKGKKMFDRNYDADNAAMGGAYTGTEFITFLNKYAQGKNAAVSMTQDQEYSLDWEPPKFEYEFTEHVDLVIVGPCSDGFMTSTNPVGALAAGMINILEDMRNPSARRERAQGTDFFDEVLNGEDKPRAVIVLSRCCGQFDRDVQKSLVSKYPQTQWVFPNHNDFCGCAGAGRVVYALTNEKLLVQKEK